MHAAILHPLGGIFHQPGVYFNAAPEIHLVTVRGNRYFVPLFTQTFGWCHTNTLCLFCANTTDFTLTLSGARIVISNTMLYDFSGKRHAYYDLIDLYSAICTKLRHFNYSAAAAIS